MRSASPIDPSERIGTIDILRGIALFVVLIINTATEFRFQSSNSFCLLQKQRDWPASCPKPSFSHFIPGDLFCFHSFSG